MKTIVCSLIILSSCALSARAAEEVQPISEIPANIPTCSEKDQNINECIRAAFQEMMPRLRNGLKELNIPPLDPFVVEKSNFEFSNGIVQGRVAVRNARIHGFSEGTFDKVDLQIKDGNVRMETQWHVSHMLIEGNYKAEIKLNDIKMTPKGYFNVSMTDLKMVSKPEGELYERNGHTYMRLTKFNVEPEVGDMVVYASGLFPDPTLSAVVLEFVNQYWRQMYTATLPQTRRTWEPLIIHFGNEFFSTVPFDLLITKN